MVAVQKVNKRENLRRNEEKWTVTLMDAGWTAIPSILLEKQHAFGLDAIDINIILHLARHWWRKDNPPYPSKKTIAECMGIDISTVRRRIATMEKKGLVRRIYRNDPRYGQQTNAYKFDGLIEKATPYAQESIDERNRQRMERQARRRSKPAYPVRVTKNTNTNTSDGE